MQQYALIENNSIVKIQFFEDDWNCGSVQHKFDWRPVVEETPKYNQDSQTLTSPEYIVEKDCVRAIYVVEDVNMNYLILNAQNRIDEMAENARLKWITHGAGQAMEYIKTEQEASEILKTIYGGGEIKNESDFPMIKAEKDAFEANGENKTLEEVAQSVIELQTAWQSVGAEIKKIRRTAKIALEKATGKSQIAAIVNSVKFPTP